MQVWALLIACLLGGGSAHGEIVEAIAATVDKEVILYSEVTELIGPELDALRLEAKTEDEFSRRAEALARESLMQAVDSKILYREAVLSPLSISDQQVEQEVEDRLQSFRKSYPSQEEFRKELAEAGETVSDLRARLRKQVLARAMAVAKQRQFQKEATVSESEVAQYYEEHTSDFVEPERVWCRQICLFAEEAEARARARARLEALKEEIDAGADFAGLAMAHSEALGAEEGGAIRWVTDWVVRGQLQQELEEVLFTLPEGGVSDIVETADALRLLKVDKREEAGLATLEEKRTEIQPLLRERAAAERYQKWIGELRKRSRVTIFL